MEQNKKPKREQEHPLIRLTNFEAEEAVLGGILIDPEALFEVSHFLEPKHFFRDINAWIYEAFLTLVNINRPLDLITVCDELRRREKLDQVGGEAYVIGLINTVPTAINTVHYARIIEALKTRRELVAAAEAILRLATDQEQGLEEVMSASERVLFDIGHNGSTGEVRHIRDIAGDHMDKIERINAGEEVDPPIKTGFQDVDNILSAGGLEKGQLVMIPADTGMGKSSLLIDIMINAARAGHKGALFTRGPYSCQEAKTADRDGRS
jgi:replicative DNA helicase